MNTQQFKYLILGAILGILITVLVNKIINLHLGQTKLNLQPAVTKIENNNQTFPTLDLPKEYFSSDTTESAYRSYPSTNVKQEIYDAVPYYYEKREYNDGVSIRAFDPRGDKYWEGLMQEKQAKYGDLVITYWPDFLVGNVEKFDVDNDGNKEQIVDMLPPGVNGKGARVDIVKNGKIIFTDSDYYVSIEPTKTNNGFYLVWTSGDQFDQGKGETRTRFVFENGKFIPVWEQEIIYTKIGKSD